MRLSEAHKVVYHYTTFSGLEGILRSNSLWMTHYQHLNDSTEVHAFKEIMTQAISHRTRSLASKLSKENYNLAREIVEIGGLDKFIKTETDKLISIIYESTFSKLDGRPAFTTPYILSFCTHDKDNHYVQKNGLLSMWRSYGNQGGYALVLNTRELENILEEENKNKLLAAPMFSDVTYNDSDIEKLEKQYSNLFEIIDDIMKSWANTGSPPNNFAENLLPSFLKATTTFKHEAFIEEREVRMVFSPLSNESLSDPTQHVNLGRKKYVDIRHRYQGGKIVPYIIFNDKMTNIRLPISGIIVGPQHDMKTGIHYLKSQNLLGAIPITYSDTPFKP